MTMLMDNLFEYWSKKADKPHLDMRTLEQRKRDFAMIKFWHNNQHDIERPSDDILPGLRIVVHKGVFPPTISVAGDPLLKALGLAANKLWKDKKVDQFKRVGVDIGTGCGILALMLAKYCQKVWATDLGEAEIENARENFERFKKLSTEKTCDFDAKQDNLFGQFSGSFQEGMVPLIVFNHPFYPSMHTVFGTGGEKGGREIIHEFLVAALGVLKTTKGGAIVMPYSEIAGDLHDPRSVATIFGYEAEILAEPKEQYGKSTIYMFTYNPRK
jgi:precorrin-6B methylase 2